MEQLKTIFSINLNISKLSLLLNNTFIKEFIIKKNMEQFETIFSMSLSFNIYSKNLIIFCLFVQRCATRFSWRQCR